MQFGTYALAEAEGAILAHSTRTRAGVLKKGRTLTADDIGRLRDAGFTEVVAAKLAPDDVAEDVAAERIARCIAGPGTRMAAPFTGRANVFAAIDGLALADTEAILRLNAVDERITLATVGRQERVVAGQMLATVKVIPFAVPEAVIAAAEVLLRGGSPVRVAAFAPCYVGLILTAFEATKPQVLDRRREAVATRLAAFGSRIGSHRVVEHTVAAVRHAVTEMAASGVSPILVFATSAIVDRADVIPAGLVAAGGRIVRLGMPVDPGNLLLMGQIGDTPVVGLPSCAASLKLNGFDWVLERVLAGVATSSADIAGMAVGGLLKEIETRPQPRAGDVGPAAARHAPKVAAVILAAGRSTRMGTENKLLAPVAGTPIVRRVAEAALASTARPVHVVVGHMADAVRGALQGLDVTFVENQDYAVGLSTSLARGIASLPQSADGALVMLGDMPEIAAGLVERMLAAFDPLEGRGIVVPVAGGKRGNPVLWARSYFAEMALVGGDSGAKHLLGAHADAVVEISADEAVHADIDTPDALARLRARSAAVP